MSSDKLPVFSFVLPAYNEESNIEIMAQRLIAVGEKLNEPFEIVWVNDGSTDQTGEILERLAQTDSRIIPVHFSRNFGHMAALTAGLETARGTGAVICLDSDGQHPPELVPDMADQWKSGADIVQAVRMLSPHEGIGKRFTSKLFYRVMRYLADIEMPEGSADFRLLDRQAVDALNSLPERERFVRGLVCWIGFRKETLRYEAPPRLAGKTKYSLWKMMVFALVGITSFSARPLRISFLLGVLVTCAAALYAIFILWCFVTGKPLVPGWTSMLLVVLLLSGVQLVTLGIASEYLARLYFEQKHRPVYLVRKKRNASRNGN